jgi:ribonuclease E
MTNKGGSKKLKTNPTKGKRRILPPGTLNEQRNLIRQKKCTTQKFAQASTASYQPRVPPLIATPTQIEAPTKTTVPAKASAPTKSVALDKTLAPAQIVGPTPSPIHSSTPEVFRFMPTPGLGLESMVNNSQHASREALANEDVQQTYHDVDDDDDDNDNEDEDEDEEAEEEEEEVVGQGNVPQQLERKDDKGRIIIQPFGKG